MRKIASHYWLRPDGSVGKFPIITFNQEKEIVEIREREAFKEEPSLELVNGFLVPGFVDFFPSELAVSDEDGIKKRLNGYLINGVKLLGTQANIFNTIKELSKNIYIVKTSIHRIENELTFAKIKRDKDSISSLLKYTYGNAKLLDMQKDFGYLEVGKRPGLLSIQKMDYSKFQINDKSKLKIII